MLLKICWEFLFSLIKENFVLLCCVTRYLKNRAHQLVNVKKTQYVCTCILK